MASRLAEYLMSQPLYGAGQRASQEGTSTAPVRSMWEGLARALQGGVGGLMQGYAMGQAKEEKGADDDALAAYMGNPNDPALAAAASGHPSFPTVATSRLNMQERLAAQEESRARSEEMKMLLAQAMIGSREKIAAMRGGGGGGASIGPLGGPSPTGAPPPVLRGVVPGAPTPLVAPSTAAPGPSAAVPPPAAVGPVAAPLPPMPVPTAPAGVAPEPAGPLPNVPSVPVAAPPIQRTDAEPPAPGPVIAQGGGPEGNTPPVPGAVPRPAGPPASTGGQGNGQPLPPAAPRNGAVVTESPAAHGFQPVIETTRAHPAGRPVVGANGMELWMHPQTKDMVLYDRKGEAAAGKQWQDVTGPDGAIIGQRNQQTNAFRPVRQDKPGAASIPQELRDVTGQDFVKSPYFQSHPARNTVIGMVDGSFTPNDLGRAGNRQELLSLAKQIDPNYTPSEGDSLRRFRTIYMNGSGQGGQTVLAANTAVDHMQTYHDLMNALSNTGSPPTNAVVNFLKKNFGNADLTNAQAARTILGAEIAKTVRGGGSLNLEEERAAAAMIDPNASPAQSQGALETLTKLMMGRVHNLQEFAKTKGVPEKETEGYMFPASRAALDYMRANPIGSKRAAPGGNTPAPGGAPPRMAQPKTEAEYKALPSGTPYMHPTLGPKVKP